MGACLFQTSCSCYLLMTLAQPVSCNLWADKTLAQAAVWDKNNNRGVAKCFSFLSLCCMKILVNCKHEEGEEV